MAKPPRPPKRERLFDNGVNTVTLSRAPGPARPLLVVTFDPMGKFQVDRPGFGEAFLNAEGYDVVCVQKRIENWYQALPAEALAEVVRPLAAGYAGLVTYGSSAGGYAALYYAPALGARALAFSPRVSIHPDYPEFGHAEHRRAVRFEHATLVGAATLGRASQAMVVFDPRVPEDLIYVEREIRPAFPEAQILPAFHAGHPCITPLAEMRVLKRVVLGAIEQGLAPPLGLAGRKSGAPLLPFRLAQEAVARQRPKLALALLDRVLAMDNPAAMALRGRALRLQGQVLDGLGRPAEALTAVEAASRLAPGDAGCLRHMAALLTQLDRLPEALAQIEAAIALAPERSDAHRMRSRLLDRLGRGTEALAAAGIAVSLAPGDAGGRRQLAWLLARQDRPAEALAEIDRAIASPPGVAEAFRIRSMVLDRLGRSAEALAPAEAAVALAPADAASLRHLSALRRRLGSGEGRGGLAA